mmetsp:Transcript_85161/g.155191  ORF Transcript_85161/g.155191 Transcript_85161/m.155191 type:complete len:429 (-) Transcript_85161:133-1419(-)
MGQLISTCTTMNLKSEELQLDQKAVLLVPGMCSNGLQCIPGGLLEHGHSGPTVAYINITKTVAEGPHIFHELSLVLDQGTLQNGTKVTTVKNKYEGEVRAVEGLEGIATLNPGMRPHIFLWNPMIQALRHDYHLRALHYDWSRWGEPVQMERCLIRFKKDVEELYAATGIPIGLVAHSMGAQVTLYCLGMMGAAWARLHISEIVFCAPAVAGTPCMFSCFSNGPLGSTGMFNFPLELVDDYLAEMTSSFVCMPAEMPMNVGGVEVWDRDRVFASTPSKKYKASNVQEFLNDCARYGDEKDTWQIGKTFWPTIQKMATVLRAPPVETHIIYSPGCDCVAATEYETDNLLGPSKTTKTEPGDNTITAASVEAMVAGWKKMGCQHVTMHKIPKKDGVNHQGCIDCAMSLDLVPKLLNPYEETDDDDDAVVP